MGETGIPKVPIGPMDVTNALGIPFNDFRANLPLKAIQLHTPFMVRTSGGSSIVGESGDYLCENAQMQRSIIPQAKFELDYAQLYQCDACGSINIGERYANNRLCCTECAELLTKE